MTLLWQRAWSEVIKHTRIFELRLFISIFFHLGSLVPAWWVRRLILSLHIFSPLRLLSQTKICHDFLMAWVATVIVCTRNGHRVKGIQVLIWCVLNNKSSQLQQSSWPNGWLSRTTQAQRNFMFWEKRTQGACHIEKIGELWWICVSHSIYQDFVCEMKTTTVFWCKWCYYPHLLLFSLVYISFSLSEYFKQYIPLDIPWSSLGKLKAGLTHFQCLCFISF